MDSFKGQKSLLSFSPGWSDSALLEKTLIGRRDLVDRLEELAIDGAGGSNKHQRLTIGPRGSGKTHVLRVLHNRLWQNTKLKDRLLIVYLLEDELGVASFKDFVVRMLRAIIRWYPEQTELPKSLEKLYDLPLDAQEPRAVQLLLRAAAEKDIAIIMENLGLTFDEKKGFGRYGQQAFRDLVQGHPHFMIFASSQALDQSIKDPNAPFYSFFKVVHLRRLSLDEAMTFMATMASAYGKKDVVNFLNTPRGRGRMRTIYEFTGGNHRLLVVFYEFMTADSIAGLSELFIQALGPLKPYYQEQMRSLSAQQQKIVQYLSLERAPRTVKDIARACLVAPNTISSQLKDLLDKSFVSRIQHGRESYYEITEALFRICHEAELDQEGAPVRLFVDFLANLYTAEELRLRQRGFSLLATRPNDKLHVNFAEEAEFYSRAISFYHPGFAADISRTLSSGIKPEEEINIFFEEMDKTGAYREIIHFAEHLADKKDAFILHITAKAYEKLGDRDKAIVHANEALVKDENDVAAHILLARVLSRNPVERETALKHAQTACELEPENPRAIESLGIVKGNIGDHAAAFGHFQKLNELRPEYADGWRLTGVALESLGDPQEAEAMYRKSLELDPENTYTIEQLGITGFNAGKREEALGHFQKLNELTPEYADGWRLTGVALESLGQAQKAEAMFRKSLELDPENTNAIEQLGIIGFDTGKHEEALGHFKNLNELRPEYADGWQLTGQALESLGHAQEAEAMFRKSLELNPENTNAIEQLGILVGNAGKLEEALGHFQNLNEISPEYADGWWLTGRALESFGQAQEAEAMYRKSLELDIENADAIKQLGILVGNTGRHEEALGHFQKLNEIRPEYADGWWLTGRALESFGQAQEAETMYRKSLELDSNNAQAWSGLGRIFEEMGSRDEAERAFQEALRFGADRIDLLNSRGDANRTRDEFIPALERYEEALVADPNAFLAQFNAVSALLALGRIDDALSRFKRALITIPDRKSEPHVDGLVVRSFYENCVALFEHAATASFAQYLSSALALIDSEAPIYMQQFEESLPITVFTLLKDHERISENRYAQITDVFENVIGKRVDTHVALRFMKAGIDYLKKEDPKALLRLSKEERGVFCKELGIDEIP